ncbi:MAG: 6-carboxytetrahydropterin synthase, partial [Schleiferiaceae bacterium]
MVYIQRRETFSASHRLYNAAWSEDQNEAVFGKCSNRYGHGHNFQLIVTVKGNVNPDTGFVMNLVDLKEIMQREVIEHVDHRNLNEDVPFLKGIMPST